ncbi:hypothetical protein [Limosilactobacillus caecicola]|uniref:hypothetical protein n=1 Tax=Limosilactobacillus caecicola TaxID=2941332 RepID=UPI0020406A36|nr:hypothetical protein [Limosilactobacillus caecicola]
MHLYVIYEAASGTNWYWTGESFSKDPHKAKTYTSLKKVRKRLKAATEQYPTVFRTHPLKNCHISSFDRPTENWPLIDPKSVKYCVGRRLNADDNWLFLTSNHEFKPFDASDKSIFDSRESAINHMVAIYSDQSTEFALFSTNEQLVEKLDNVNNKSLNDVPDVTNFTINDAKQIVNSLTLVKQYAKSLKTHLANIDYVQIMDLLHYIEINDLTDEQKIKVVDKIKVMRQERRKIKDILIYLNSINNHTDANTIIKEIDRSFVEDSDERTYHYRSGNIKEFLASIDSANITN